MTELLMPALSPTMEEGTLAKWLVAVGDTVMPGDVVAEVETDKASMEVEAVEEGVIETLLVAAGSEGVKVNAPIARLQPLGSKVAAPVAPEPEPAAARPLSPAVRRIVADEGLDPAAIAGSGRDGRLTKGDVLAAAAERRPQNDTALASPLARRMAEAGGVALAQIKGSGPGGKVMKVDLDAALGRPRAEAPPAPARTEAEGRLIPLDGMRKTIARRMTDSFRDVPHFPLTIDVQLDELLTMRSALNRALEPEGIKVSLNDFIIKASAWALRQVPEANASYTPDGIVLHPHADIAVAVAIEGGLITPIVRAAETKSLAVIAAEMKDLSARARERRLRPEEFQGGTFSISNLGMFGVKTFSSILNEPQAAILSVGGAEARPVVKDGAIAVATVASITLTCDHRALDGSNGARFLSAFSRSLANPLLLMG